MYHVDLFHALPPGNSICCQDTDFNWVLRRPLADNCFALFIRIRSAGLGCPTICSQREMCKDISRKCAQLWKGEFYTAKEFYCPFDSRKYLKECWGAVSTYIKSSCYTPKTNTILCQSYLSLNWKREMVLRIEINSYTKENCIPVTLFSIKTVLARNKTNRWTG